MKKQLTFTVGLIASICSAQAFASDSQGNQPLRANTPAFTFEIALEQPLFDLSGSIREQVNTNLQQQLQTPSTLVARKNSLRISEQRAARSE